MTEHKHDPAVVESTKNVFSTQKMLETRVRARQAVEQIAAQVKVGMLEEDANQMVVKTLLDLGATKAFHNVHPFWQQHHDQLRGRLRSGRPSR
jgi:hypothetical protein